MSDKVKGISIKSNIINAKKFDPNNMKIDEKLYKNIFIHYIEYVTIKE